MITSHLSQPLKKIRNPRATCSITPSLLKYVNSLITILIKTPDQKEFYVGRHTGLDTLIPHWTHSGISYNRIPIILKR